MIIWLSLPPHCLQVPTDQFYFNRGQTWRWVIASNNQSDTTLPFTPSRSVLTEGKTDVIQTWVSQSVSQWDWKMILTRTGQQVSSSPRLVPVNPLWGIWPWTLVRSQSSHGSLPPVVVLFRGSFDSLLPPRLNLLLCYLSVSVCLKYAFLFSQIHYHRINFPLNIKYENISNIAEICWSWRLNVFTLLSNSRWPRLCEWLCGVYEVPE